MAGGGKRPARKVADEINGVSLGANKLFIWKKGWDWVLTFALTLLFFAVFLQLYGMRYEVNDDAIISNLAAGAYGGQSQYLVYVNLVFGLLLKLFFALAPQLNWFVLLLVVGGIFCFAQLGVLLLRTFGPFAGSCLFGALLLCAGSEFFVYFHYGRYAGLFLTVGLLLLAQNLGRFCPSAFLGLGLAVLGSLLRFQIFVAIGALAAPLLLWRFWPLAKTEKKSATALVVALVVLAGGLWALDATIYRQTPAWAAYWRFNRVRTEISDFRLQFAQSRDAFEEAHGYAAVDVEMMEKWAYYDGEVFPAEKLEAFTASLPQGAPLEAIKSFIRTATGMLYSTPLHLLFGVLLAAWLCLGKRKNWPVILASGGVLLLEVLYLCYRGRFPQRIDFAVVLAALCFCAAGWLWPQSQKDATCTPATGKAETASAPEEKKQVPHWAAFAFLTLLLASLPALQMQRAEMRDYWASRPPRAAEIDALAADKEHLYLLDTYLVDAANGFDVWHPRAPGYFSNMVFVGSWLMESPFQSEALQHYGLTNPYKDAIDNPNVLLADYYYRELKEDYLRRHYGEDVRIELVAECGDFNLYRVVRE